MAFQTASGYNNLPNGVFSPTVYSKKVQMAFRKETVVGDITNSEYFGEISNQGDTVRILKEPEVAIFDYARGTHLVAQDLVDEDFQLTVDQAHAFIFKLDDIEEKQAHADWMAMAASRAAYNLRDTYDRKVLAYMTGYKLSALTTVGDTVNTTVSGTKAIYTAGSDELLTEMKLSRPNFGNLTTAGSTGDSIPLAPRLPGATSIPTTTVSPVQLINRMKLRLDQQLVPTDGRWLVISPEFEELLLDEDSRFGNADFGANGSLRSGNTPVVISGFKIYRSTNLPSVGTGPGTTGTSAQSSNYGVIVGGHRNAVATAEQINKTEKYRDPFTFADVARGLHMFGRKILRPEAIVRARYNIA